MRRAGWKGNEGNGGLIVATPTVLETVRAELRRKLVDLRGTDAFADALAERERVLGLLDQAPTPQQPVAADTVDASAANDAPAEEAEEAPTLPSDPLYDPWGNEILEAPGRFGQYRVRGAWPNRIVRVCGEVDTSKHLFAWDYDTSERRFVCRVCWPVMPTSLTTPATAKTAKTTKRND
jgi:hypothetical protein